MAINVGNRPEQLLRGMDRLFAAVADAIPQFPALPRRNAQVPAGWLIERGTTRLDLPVNVYGGYPGSLRSLNRMDDVRVIGTIRYLVVGEGTSYGFAIPMRDVLEVAVVRPDRQSNPGLRVWYRDHTQTGSFFIDFRGLARGISGLPRAEHLMQFLVERGVRPVDATDAGTMASPHMSWERARQHISEEMIWSGNGRASVGGWFGTTQDYCRIWLTSTSLLWAGAHREGVNRVALSDILQARDGVGDRVCVGIADDRGHRFDLSFDLSQDQVDLRREDNPRVRFMNALASQGVAVGSASTPLAPWRAGSLLRPSERMHQAEGAQFALR